MELTFVSEFPDEAREKWETFVSGTLAEMNKQNTVELVSNTNALVSFIHTSDLRTRSFCYNFLPGQSFSSIIQIYLKLVKYP